MPTDSFEVQTYEVEINPHLEHAPYDIILTGPRSIRGVQRLAHLDFRDDPSAGEGYVTDVDQPFEGHSVYAILDMDYFEHMYELLQTEEPVTFHYDHFEVEDVSFHDIGTVRLGTSEEPVGEGLADKTP